MKTINLSILPAISRFPYTHFQEYLHILIQHHKGYRLIYILLIFSDKVIFRNDVIVTKNDFLLGLRKWTHVTNMCFMIQKRIPSCRSVVEACFCATRPILVKLRQVRGHSNGNYSKLYLNFSKSTILYIIEGRPPSFFYDHTNPYVQELWFKTSSQTHRFPTRHHCSRSHQKIYNPVPSSSSLFEHFAIQMSPTLFTSEKFTS